MSQNRCTLSKNISLCCSMLSQAHRATAARTRPLSRHLSRCRWLFWLASHRRWQKDRPSQLSHFFSSCRCQVKCLLAALIFPADGCVRPMIRAMDIVSSVHAVSVSWLVYLMHVLTPAQRMGIWQQQARVHAFSCSAVVGHFSLLLGCPPIPAGTEQGTAKAPGWGLCDTAAAAVTLPIHLCQTLSCYQYTVVFELDEESLPILSKVAQVYLGMSSSSVPVECMFSTTGIISNGKKSSTGPEKLNKVVFIHDNFSLAVDGLQIIMQWKGTVNEHWTE